MMRRNLWIASAIAVVVVMTGLLVYGSYISAQYQMEALQTAAHEQWLQLEGAIRRWADATPQLETAMAPVARQDRMVLDTLASARQTVHQARDPQAVIDASRALDEALNGAMAVGLSDPVLQKDAQFHTLRERLRQMRVRVAQDRERYNESLRNYNVFISEFPNSIWARIAGFGPDHRFFPRTAGES